MHTDISKITIDVASSSDETVLDLAEVFSRKAARGHHLAAGVPEEHAEALDRGADKDDATAQSLRDVVAKRRAEYAERRHQLLCRHRRPGSPMLCPAVGDFIRPCMGGFCSPVIGEAQEVIGISLDGGTWPVALDIRGVPTVVRSWIRVRGGAS